MGVEFLKRKEESAVIEMDAMQKAYLTMKSRGQCQDTSWLMRPTSM